MCFQFPAMMVGLLKTLLVTLLIGDSVCNSVTSVSNSVGHDPYNDDLEGRAGEKGLQWHSHRNFLLPKGESKSM